MTEENNNQQQDKKILKEKNKQIKADKLAEYKAKEALKKENTPKKVLTKSEKRKKFLAWTAFTLVIIVTLAMLLLSGLLSAYELKDDSSSHPGIPSLTMSLSVFVGTVISLLIVLALAWHFFWDPIGQLLEARKEKIENEIQSAEQLNNNADLLNNKSEQNLEKSKKQALEIIGTSKQEGLVLKKEIMDIAKEQSDEMLDKAREQIESEKIQMQEDIKNEIIETSILAAEKIIEQKLSTKDNKKMVEELISNLQS